MFKESKVNDKLIILGLLKDKRNIYRRTKGSMSLVYATRCM